MFAWLITAYRVLKFLAENEQILTTLITVAQQLEQGIEKLAAEPAPDEVPEPDQK